MIVGEILYSNTFCNCYKKISVELQNITKKKVEIFKTNPLHPSLRLHELHGKLSGLWSISINTNYRIIFKRKENGDIIFVIIGKHDTYKNLNN
ncbi:MAG: Plasmid stabilization system [Candidatus Falkowbacteria bacterium GW2011_GWC2_38_22]|uniref:Plasmid stabilization system n=1 Tax=Candidatus Falkowbacteria bacterium GW2011_GWE1_38_31 TaxID=1618638 RepID=A0A0G0K4F4_9BACT|nr:MAG: Plasmid stabilization system [Candidatus Falkowbacteria bacterium GW2011_GWF2_38_1205]KKQ61546.1 MAG: Plasmid stabilization system [Candidatus Falkowbacteria bacterium GW2011_GWC2_38_22]KKQ63561.1 MAG: Plasmid stabilization system [Candidatus Falkowbacteria bacterium GW2011_GWF1_38_22]KKQ65713.1 MAG: Plasmid stabilization system [Candidatus Falkowbacteria bacterium GW2011_GWE2_38_254]KKQ70330.1 MAG: Plasmid stabilization system [Candidatus Falkowbacteria bacterium GW2011_GWE1_38_31]KKQ